MKGKMLYDLSKVGLLSRREIEARISGPLIRAFIEEFGEEKVLSVAERVISALGKGTGTEIAKGSAGGNGIEDFAREYIFKGSRPVEEGAPQDLSGKGSPGQGGEGKRYLSEGNAIEFLLYERGRERLFLDVIHCRFADMYRELGLSELGYLLSCGRDFALIEGFNPEIRLKRTKTLMEGGNCCDFRIEMKNL
ncbi:MAG: hypothetical protein EHM36_15985 [Deltaproteobacteria bacterium]|nr:MAG: hypothetical protein EHM36_15985 [Deltaproteobacteria bacterium]